MKESNRKFPAFGARGDHIGARRGRRAFRLCVLGFVAFTCVLWIGERFLRYEQPERLYLTSLTHHPASARVFLQQAVRADEANREFPSPRYLEALAEREEEDEILPTYERAHQVDPDNASLNIRYGCRLALEEEFGKARRHFALAAANAPKNALPMYLEAAVAPWAADTARGTEEGNRQPDLAGSLALVARTNSSGNSVVFPKPLWHGDLPQHGIWYANLRRQIIDDCCAPLFRYRDFVIRQADRQIEEREVQYWDSWLETLDRMGSAIAEGALPKPDSPGPPLAGAALAAQAGLTIRLAALNQREHIRQREGGRSDPALSAQRRSLEEALNFLQKFENARPGRLAESRAAYVLPGNLIGGAGGLLMLGYVVSMLLAKVLRCDAAARAIPYPRWCTAVLLGGAFVLLAVLVAIAVLQESLETSAETRRVVEFLWWGIFALWFATGLFFPAWDLPSARTAAEGVGELEEMDQTLRQARRSRRRAYLILLRRYFGTAFGLLVCISCAWVIGYRVCTGMYPWQFELLITGLAGEEAEAVRHALGLLN